jgi:hypothetical protein
MEFTMSRAAIAAVAAILDSLSHFRNISRAVKTRGQK